ncbi:MAG: peptide alpha-N-acetyltransferase [Bacillariaceae sp.]|jgi:peptide alpha-N-acetyltransferase
MMGDQTTVVLEQKICGEENNNNNNNPDGCSGGDDDDAMITFVDYHDESQLKYVDQLVACDLSEPYSVFTYRYFLHRFPDLCILAVDGISGEVCGCVVGKIDVEKFTNHNNNNNKLPPDENDHDTNNDNIDNTTSMTDEDKNSDRTAIIAKSDDGGATTTTTSPTIEKYGAAEINTSVQIQTGYIGMLAVRKSYRRKGIGKDLVQQVLKRMKERGCTSVTLETETSNSNAQKLYQNHFGFIREELLVRYYLNCGDAYRLRLWF